MNFLANTAAFQEVFGRKLTSSGVILVARNISKRTVPGTVFFRPEYCFHVPCIFPAGKRLEFAGKSTDSCSIVWDPVAGSIDLGILCIRCIHVNISGSQLGLVIKNKNDQFRAGPDSMDLTHLFITISIVP